MKYNGTDIDKLTTQYVKGFINIGYDMAPEFKVGDADWSVVLTTTNKVNGKTYFTGVYATRPSAKNAPKAEVEGVMVNTRIDTVEVHLFTCTEDAVWAWTCLDSDKFESDTAHHTLYRVDDHYDDAYWTTDEAVAVAAWRKRHERRRARRTEWSRVEVNDTLLKIARRFTGMKRARRDSIIVHRRINERGEKVYTFEANGHEAEAKFNAYYDKPARAYSVR